MSSEPIQNKVEVPAEETKDTADTKLYKDEITGDMVSKNEIKKRQKQREKEAKDKIKAEEKKAKADLAPAKKEKANVEEEDLDPSKYTDNRKNWIQAQRDMGKNPYPHKFERTHRIDEFRAEFDTKITECVFLEDVTVSVTGRINTIRA